MKTFYNIKMLSCCILLPFCFFECSRESPPVIEKENTQTRFTLLQSDLTGVKFQNKLEEGPNTNVLVYEYFYNGGGVSAGDFNGDGLEDLYFTSNMGKNAMYLNKGNMKFEEITQISNTSGRPGPWKTGTTVVDINGDNKLDIYLCYSGALPAIKRKNQLFINQGNDERGHPMFLEEAAKYGLDSDAFSNQSYFFDCDKDGDLDMLLLNHNPNSLPILNEVKTQVLLAENDAQKGLRLFKQSAGIFEDVTATAGINGSSLSYGLGIGIADINNDGWPDFYVSNDYAVGDYLYINNQDGTFTDSLKASIGHTSQFSMGNDIADINNDGFQDILTLDMLPEDNKRQKLLLAPDNYEKFNLNVRNGFHFQYMRNMLQINNGNGTFSEIGQFSGISNTDWSWSALLADFDNDGMKDLYVTNGYLKDYTNLDFINYMDNYVRSKGKLLRSDVLEIIKKMPASQLSNYMYANDGGLTFKDQTKFWGLNYSSNSNGAAYTDLDNDGDLDLVTNNVNQLAFIFQNETNQLEDKNYLKVKLNGSGLNSLGIGAKLTIYQKGLKQQMSQYLSRGYLSTVSPIIHFGLGASSEIDSLHVLWPDGTSQLIKGIKPNQMVTVAQEEASSSTEYQTVLSSVFTPTNIPFKQQFSKNNVNDFKRQSLLINGLSFSGPCIAKGDLNNDGLEDIFVGGGKDESAQIYFQSSDGKFSMQPPSAFQLHKASVDIDVAMVDVDNDGDKDLFVASGGYHLFGPNDPLLTDRVYINNGKGSFGFKKDALPEYTASAGCMAINDVNKDGFIDIFIGSRVVPGRYPEPPESLLLVNDGKGNFINQINELAPELAKIGMVTDALWLDMNADEHKDLVVIGEWMPITIFIRNEGKYEDKTLDYFDKLYTGWWNKIQHGDFNGDGLPDFIVGNFGTNTQLKPNDNQPAELHYADFDNNGAVDPIFSFYIQGKSFPFLTRDELLNQLPKLKSKFNTYESFASATLPQILDQKTIDEAGYYKVNHLHTSLFISSDRKKLAQKPLPQEVQFAPVFTINLLDFNSDGYEDLLLCGNSSYAKLRLGKIDANYGMLLQGDGRGNFTYINQRQSGLKLKGNVRQVLKINDTWLFGFSDKPFEAYKVKTDLLP